MSVFAWRGPIFLFHLRTPGGLENEAMEPQRVPPDSDGSAAENSP